MKVILAEKPSVARDIAKVLGAQQKRDGWLEGNGYQVTWAFGHLVSIVEPEVMNKSWGGKWGFHQLPMIPENFQLTSPQNTSKQFNTISRLFKECDEIINATDAGREGELIFRWIYRHSDCAKSFQRLWISDLTDESIRKGFANLHEGKKFDNLGHSAQCRAFADWMVGLNATRAYTVRNGQLYTVGRVQTPTLALIVERHKLINGFDKVFYYELYAHVGKVPFRWEDKDGYKIDKKEKAESLKKSLEGKTGVISYTKTSKKKTSPPSLYDLTLLQKECNEKFGYTAEDTLKYAQALYEQHKLITYPRTESRHLAEAMRGELPAVLKSSSDEFQAFAAVALERLEKGHKLGKAYINDKKLTDHHAIIPTNKKLSQFLEPKLKNVYDLVQKRFIAIFLEDYLEEVSEVGMEMNKEKFKWKGSLPVNLGWKAIHNYDYKKGPATAETISNNQLLSQYPIRPDVVEMKNMAFKKGKEVEVDSLEVKEKETSPPKPYTDGTLLNAMRYIGRQVDDESLAAQLKDQGLGTQATRASIIERLIKSKYVYRKGKNILPTQKGISLIDTVVTDLKSPELTAQWEVKLSEIQDGKLKYSMFMEEIQDFTRSIIPLIKGGGGAGQERKGSFGQCPKCKKGKIYHGKKAYYCSQYKGKDGCKFVLWETVASLVLPEEEVKKILKDGISGEIKGFKSRKGTLFSAKLEIDKNFDLKFVF